MFKYILIVIVGIMLYLDTNKNKQIDNELKKYKSTDAKSATATESKTLQKEKPSHQ